MTGNGRQRVPRAPTLVDALLPLACLVVLIVGASLILGLDALDGPHG